MDDYNIMNGKSAVVVGLGEILWDIFPDSRQLGGAPANMACHARMLKADAFLVSCVGQDTLGEEACERLDEIGLNRKYLAISDEYPTGTVDVKLDEQGKPDYTIHENVAWDHIPWSPELEELASQADAVCFGSLVQRGEVSRQTVRKFLGATRSDCLRVFDINLRQSYYSREIISRSLEESNVLKLNDDELLVLAKMFKLFGTAEEMLLQLVNGFELKLVVLTCGEHGSQMVASGQKVECEGFNVKIADTVGAGDAFTAAMIMGLLRGVPLERINTFACRVGAFVCSQSGAIPDLPANIVNDITTG